MILELLWPWSRAFVSWSICLAPVLCLHWWLAIRCPFLKFSLAMQKIISLSFFLVPCLLVIVPKKMGESKSAPIFNSWPEIIFDLLFFLMQAVLICSAMGLGLLLWRYLKQERATKRLRDGSELKKHDDIEICSSDLIDVPFSIGLIQKRIFLPQEMPLSQRKVIEEHERTHCDLHHHEWSLWEAILSHLFWFNPLAHIIRQTGHTLRELECDQVTADKVPKLDYARTLVETAERYATLGAYPIRGQGWSHQGGIRMRIRRLLSPLPKKAPVLLATLTFTFVFALVAAYQVAMHLGHDEEAKILASLRSSYAEATKKRDLVILEKVPGHFTQALLTHEDRRFLEHHGLNWSSTLRAAFQNLSSYLRGGPAIVSGASTLTQQLAKNLLFSQQKKSLGRKIRQLQASRILEQNFSKEDILTMYLNVVYFGQGAWGLAQAGKVYFQTSYEKLSLEQSAMLVPFLEAPAIYNMVHNPQLAKKRQDHLLAKLQQN